MMHTNTSEENFRALLARRTRPPHPGWKAPPASEVPRLMMSLGSFYERAESKTQAFQAYQRAFKLGSSGEETCAALLRTAGDPALRARLDHLLSENAASNPAARRFLARLHLDREPARALREIDGILAGEPDHPEALKLRVQALMSLGQTESALEIAQRIAELRPGDVEGWRLLASASLSKGTPARAIAAAEVALSNRPDDAQTMNLLAAACAQSGQMDRAGQLFRAAVDKDPTNTQFRLNLALYLLGERRITESEEQFRAALDIEPLNVHCILGMGELFRARRVTASALYWYRQALHVSPRHPIALERIRELIGEAPQNSSP